MSTTHNLLLASTATTTALVAGLLFAYACSVNPGLNQLPDAAYLAAMKAINRAIQNPAFFLIFMGTAVLLPLSTWVYDKAPLSTRFWLLLGATILYLVGVLGVTLAGNVPLNEALESVDLQAASVKEMAEQRARFEGSWNRLHLVRTVASVLATLLVIEACLTGRDGS